MLNHEESRVLFERAQRALAGGVSSEFRKSNAPHPLVYVRAHGARLVDADENEYLDFALSQGPMVLGHSHPEVLEAVERASHDGQLYAALHLAEIELAEKLQEIIPCAELVRFSVSGSEAAHAALRVARAVTGRQKFVRFEGHYHGWFDNIAWGINGASLEALGPREAPIAQLWTQGLPTNIRDEFILLPWNDLTLAERTVAQRHDEIAAIITEPIMCNTGCIEPQPGYLEGLRALCDRYGIALIFDEVITGFRVHVGGAQAYYGVTPDLAVFAKAMANGYPISALVGKRAWMQPIAEGSVIHAGTTNAGNPSVAAAKATIEVMQRERVHEKLHRLGKRLQAGLCEAARETGHDVLVQGPGPVLNLAFTSLLCARDMRDTFAFNKAKLARFVYGLQEEGVRILSRGTWYLCAAHTEADIDFAVRAARKVLAGIQ
ncbi:MAG: aspartate aminotransferase family protein [Candidatus Thermofonsia Clade 3 bacterium]|jgi:glutamate-1-semialdehyde 2,1-aminomutase|uniref:Aspartate aminotransferase family protein n=1 Tax=Candidatus Thermofonsia Clade 3 bacterium TaxID=2364212 RepID=A0A2M8QFS6_9CHLR|nr:MAG: aspartate aminotransferase family protein [Candidatus Thermofonsia Clade 3 bacterium]